MGVWGRFTNWLTENNASPVLSQLELTPADGTVEVIPVPNVHATPSVSDRRFGKFVSIESREGKGSVRRGGVPPLLGRVAIGSFFLGMHGKGWKDEEIAGGMHTLIRAGEWIEREAIRQNAAVNIRLLDTYFVANDPVVMDKEVEIAILPEGDGEGLHDAHAEVNLMASVGRASQILGFRDIADLVSRIRDLVDCDTLVWLVHVRSRGRSFVVTESVSAMRGVNLAFCFAAEDDFPGRLVGPPLSDPTTFAHELLHLFGATDKYAMSLDSFPPDSVTRMDIMRLEVETLKRLRINPLTAEEIGWTINGKPLALLPKK